MKWPLLGLLWVWRTVVSPLYGPVCRYHPSCSSYAVIAVRQHGAVRGGWLAVRRVARCNPWSWGGYDPVPGTDPAEDAARAATAHPGPAELPTTDPGTSGSPAADHGADQGADQACGHPTHGSRHDGPHVRDHGRGPDPVPGPAPAADRRPGPARRTQPSADPRGPGTR